MLPPHEWSLHYWDNTIWWRTYQPGGYDGYRTIGGRKLPCATLATALSKPEMREEIRSLSRQSLRNRLHRKGIARLLNSRSESLSDRGGAYVETRGPRWLARHLAIWVVRNSGTRADWTTIRITSTAQQGRWHWRFHLAYRRIR